MGLSWGYHDKSVNEAAGIELIRQAIDLGVDHLGRGFLTGAIGVGVRFGPEDFRSKLPRFRPEAVAENQRIVERVGAIAGRRGATAAQIALAWVLAQGEQVLAIPGTQRHKYLEQNVASAEIALTPEELAELDALPAPVGGRY